MADEADRAGEYTETGTSAAVAAICAAASYIPPGKPGECDLCGEWSGRLVNGACCPCRDKHGLD